MREVNLHIHWKQGDDLRNQLKHANDNAVQGLRNWADTLSDTAEELRKVAAALEGKDISIRADTHHIAIDGLSDTDIDKMEKVSPIVGIYEYEDEEDFEDEGDFESEDCEEADVETNEPTNG